MLLETDRNGTGAMSESLHLPRPRQRRLPQIIGSATFRWAAVAALIFAGFVVLLFAFAYWRTDSFLTRRSDNVIALQAKVLAELPPGRREEAIAYQLASDPRGVQFVALFAPDGHKLAGNLDRPPASLAIDDRVQAAQFIRDTTSGPRNETVRGIARTLPDGQVLVVGREVDEAIELSTVVAQTLALGLIPALFLCIAAGMLMSIRAQNRILEVNQRVQRIVAGSLDERIPHEGGRDQFSELAGIVNGMLDEMETLIHALAGVGNDIAHDMRTPLTRARLLLERGRLNAPNLRELQLTVDKAIIGIDQSLAIVTALLRLAEIENSRRSASFGDVPLGELVREVGDMYEPIAENKGVALKVATSGEFTVRGDRDLLIEAVANLVDNAVKFAPAGGRVDISLLREDGERVIRISDNGDGIGESEMDAVLRRFYRSDKNRNTPGVGLGLNLVAAITKLHGFRLAISAGPGCVVDIVCPAEPA
jgi:signal transduction histidine kinase